MQLYCLIAMGLVLYCIECSCNQGTEFIIAFPKSYPPDSVPSITIVCVGDHSVTVEVSVPLAPEILNLSYTIGGRYDDHMSLNMSPSLTLTTSGVSNHTVYVRSSDDIVLSVSTSRFGSNVYSRGTYLALPVSHLGTRYHAVTYCEKTHCFVVVVAAHRSVTARVTSNLAAYSGSPSVIFESKTYVSGDVITRDLNAFGNLQILGVAVDLSGSIVETDGAVAVITGGSMTSVTSISADNVVEQIPPADSYGTSYVIVNYPITEYDAIVKVVFTTPGTNLTFDPAVMRPRNVRPWSAEYDLTSREMTFLSSDRPILVTLLSRGAGSTTMSFDPALVLVNPVTTWSKAYTLAYIAEYREVVVMSLVTYMSCSSLFWLNGQAIVNPLWREDSSHLYQTFNLTLTAVNRIIVENKECQFGGFLSCRLYWNRNAIPLGFVYSVIESSSSSSSSTMTPDRASVDVSTGQTLSTSLTLDHTIYSAISSQVLNSPQTESLPTLSALEMSQDSSQIVTTYTSNDPTFSAEGSLQPTPMIKAGGDQQKTENNTTKTVSRTELYGTQNISAVVEIIELTTAARGTSIQTTATSEKTVKSIATTSSSPTAISSATQPTSPITTTSSETPPTSTTINTTSAMQPTSPTTTTSSATQSTSPTTTTSSATQSTSPTTTTSSATYPTSWTNATVSQTQPTSPTTTTIPATRPTSPTTTPSTPNPTMKYCPCRCSFITLTQKLSLTQTSIQTYQREITSALYLTKSNLSSTLQRKISLPNVTQSSRDLGHVITICSLAVVCCFLFFSDFVRVCQFIYTNLQ